MRTKIIILSTSLLVSAGVSMHHFHYCPLQHLMSKLHHGKQIAPPAKDGKTPTEVLAMNK